MAQQFRALLALGEDLTSVPSIYMMVHNYQLLWFQGIPTLSSDFQGHQVCTWCTYLYVGNTHI